MTKSHPELLYNGKPMAAGAQERDTRDIWSPAFIRAKLLDDQAVAFDLQPGDATRYDLVITPVRDYSGQFGIIVSALNCGPGIRSHIIWDWNNWCSPFAIMECAITLYKNKWSQQLIHWWLGLLCTKPGPNDGEVVIRHEGVAPHRDTSGPDQVGEFIKGIPDHPVGM